MTVGAFLLLPCVALAQAPTPDESVEREAEPAAEEGGEPEVEAEEASEPPPAAGEPSERPPADATPEVLTEREVLLRRIRERRRRRQASIADRVSRGETIPQYSSTTSARVRRGSATVTRRRPLSRVVRDGRPNYTALYVLGGVLLGIGAVVALSAIFVANPPCLVLCSGSSGGGGDAEAAALTAGVGGGVGGLGLVFLILGAALDAQTPRTSGWRAGPGEVGLGFELVF